MELKDLCQAYLTRIVSGSILRTWFEGVIEMREKILGGISFNPDLRSRKGKVLMSNSDNCSSCESDCQSNCDCGTGGTCDSSQYINTQKGPQVRRKVK